MNLKSYHSYIQLIFIRNQDGNFSIVSKDVLKNTVSMLFLIEFRVRKLVIYPFNDLQDLLLFKLKITAHVEAGIKTNKILFLLAR